MFKKILGQDLSMEIYQFFDKLLIGSHATGCDTYFDPQIWIISSTLSQKLQSL